MADIFLGIRRRRVVTNAAQKRASENYRRRLAERGMARFEVLGRENDRDLIRGLARQLAEDGPQAQRLRTIIADETNAQAPSGTEIVRALRSSPLVGADIVAERSLADDREIDL